MLELARDGRSAEFRQGVAEFTARCGGKPNFWQFQARLAIAGRRHAEAEVILGRKVDPTVAPAERVEALRLRARNFALQRRLQDARVSIDAVIASGRATPLDYFALGEALRRLGAFPAAAAAFARAETGSRPGRAPEGALAAFRRRLALVEGGRDAEFGMTLAEESSRARPSPEWSLTAAAVLIQRSDHIGAARWMRAAQESLDAPRFFAWTDDYFFRQHLSRPEYRGIFLGSADRTSRLRKLSSYFIDP